MTQHQNDLSLLRPFNLEAAKSGEEICWSALDVPVKFIGAANNGVIAYDSEGELGFTSSISFRMKPLTWVEGRPVYKGDVLWYKNCNFSIVVIGPNPYQPEHGLKGTVNFADGKNPCGYVGNGKEETWAPFESWTWNKPKQSVCALNKGRSQALYRYPRDDYLRGN